MDDPRGRPRVPLRNASCTARQVVCGDSGINPDRSPGHLPVRARCASAHARIVGIIKDGRTRGPDCRPRRRSVPSPRCVRSNFASVVSPGKVRHPFSSAEFSMHQESPGDSGIGPEAARGHRPFRLWYASAQNKICFSVIGATPHGPLPGNEFRE